MKNIPDLFKELPLEFNTCMKGVKETITPMLTTKTSEKWNNNLLQLNIDTCDSVLVIKLT